VLNLGTGELLVIALVALLILGPTRLPDAARQAGKAMAEMRRMTSGFQAEMQQAMREPVAAAPAARLGAPAPPRRTEPLRAERVG
jgi:Tat protein translocase TatB subunit